MAEEPVTTLVKRRQGRRPHADKLPVVPVLPPFDTGILEGLGGGKKPDPPPHPTISVEQAKTMLQEKAQELLD